MRREVLGLTPQHAGRAGGFDTMQMAGGNRAGDPAAREGVDAFAVQLDVGANQSRDFSGRRPLRVVAARSAVVAAPVGSEAKLGRSQNA